MSTFDTLSTPLARRLRDGLDRLGAALRAEQWSAAGAVGLNPTQSHVLAFLAGRGGAGVRVKEIAAQLGVSQPTATDSIAALERKELIRKLPDPQDARATAICITSAGRDLLQAIGLAASATEAALGDLSPAEQAHLLLMVVKLIRSLQRSGAIPLQRLCVTCRHFRPFAHPDAVDPHHCAFVNAAFGDRHLRLDCSEHEQADPAVQAATWTAFGKGSASIRATPSP